jgi:hypothetical protein
MKTEEMIFALAKKSEQIVRKRVKTEDLIFALG